MKQIFIVFQGLIIRFFINNHKLNQQTNQLILNPIQSEFHSFYIFQLPKSQFKTTISQYSKVSLNLAIVHQPLLIAQIQIIIRHMSLINLSLTTLMILLQFFVLTSALYNFSCGCVQYMGNYGVLCYALPCLQIYNATTHTYSTNFTALHDTIFPELLANDGQLQAQIDALKANKTNIQANSSYAPSTSDWINNYYRDLLLGTLLLLIAAQFIYFQLKMNRMSYQIKELTEGNQGGSQKDEKRKRRPRRRQQGLNLEDFQMSFQNTDMVLVEPA